MGADQIGYLVVGPAKLDPEKVADLKALLKKAHEHIENSGMGSLDMDINNAELKAAVDELGSILGFYQLFRAMDYDMMCMDDLPTAAYVEGFVSWWDGGHSGRDVTSRTAPHDQSRVIVWAGNMTWGDTPDGYGYTMLSPMFTWDLLKLLDIE